MRFRPDHRHEVIRLYKGGASVRGLAEACGVTEEVMERFLEDEGLFKTPRTNSRKKWNKTSPQRPAHINGQELSDTWWESNDQAFCDAVVREYPGKKYKSERPEFSSRAADNGN